MLPSSLARPGRHRGSCIPPHQEQKVSTEMLRLFPSIAHSDPALGANRKKLHSALPALSLRLLAWVGFSGPRAVSPEHGLHRGGGAGCCDLR